MNNKNFFKFKEFSLDFTNCGMKLSTDAVILGSISSLKSHEVLDIGTGSGILSLMIAQRLNLLACGYIFIRQSYTVMLTILS